MMRRIDRLESKLDQMVRVGTVTAVLADTGMVRVSVKDADALVSFTLPVLFSKTHKDQFYVMPDVGEHVVCVFLPIGLEQGFVLGALYSKKDAVPVASTDKARVTFSDGSWLEHDRGASEFNLHCKGLVRIYAADKIELNGGTDDLNGVVTGDCVCQFTGVPHLNYSSNVEASKG